MEKNEGNLDLDHAIDIEKNGFVGSQSSNTQHYNVDMEKPGRRKKKAKKEWLNEKCAESKNCRTETTRMHEVIKEIMGTENMLFSRMYNNASSNS